MFWLWTAIICLSLLVFALSGKLYLMRKSAGEIEREFCERLTTETNTLIHISSRDRSMRRLADSINASLRRLRRERQRYLYGDLELKEAVTNISHDLRTPLTAICGYLDLLEQEKTPENIRRYLSFIRSRTDVLTQLTEELFRYSIVSSTQKLTPEPLVLNQVLEESLLSFYGAMRQKSIVPEISIPEQRIERLLDPSALNRIFGNIISNALKYSSGDFRVRLETDGTICFSNTADGLTPVTVEKLFDRYYTVETARSSTGLGLAIARLLTERMGGQIDAAYHDGSLTITVFFPADQPDPANAR